MSRKISFAPGEFYHIYNRGVEKRTTFLTDDDYRRLQTLFYLCNGTERVIYRLVQGETLYSKKVGKKLVAIGAYCLMPNHFHLLIKETQDGGIAKFLQKLTTAYTMYFNKKYERVGPLFQGVFRAEHLDDDNYLKYMSAYIHLNPVKLFQSDWKDVGIKNSREVKKHLSGYQYSSFPAYMRPESDESAILTREEFPEYFSDTSFESFIADWLQYKVSP